MTYNAEGHVMKFTAGVDDPVELRLKGKAVAGQCGVTGNPIWEVKAWITRASGKRVRSKKHMTFTVESGLADLAWVIGEGTETSSVELECGLEWNSNKKEGETK